MNLHAHVRPHELIRRPIESARTSTAATFANRRRLSVAKACQDRANRGRAFVSNHLRDVVYRVDLLRALKLSLDFQNRHDPLKSKEDMRQALGSYLKALRLLFPVRDTKVGHYLAELEMTIAR